MARIMAIAAVLAALTAGQAARAADKIVLQLNGPAQFEFAGYYAALWQGLYRSAGLEVAIKPDGGEPALNPLREVAERRAEFGVAPAAALVIRAAQGQPLVLLAPIFQRSGAGIYYRDDDDYASPGALAAARVGRLPASNILDVEMATALQAEGVDPDKVNSVPLQPADALAALAGKSVDAVPGSAWEFPWLAHEKGFAVKSINPADYRVEFYGDTLFTTERFAAAHPHVVRRFRSASLSGWEYALAHPDAIAARLLKDLPHPPGIADAAGFAYYQEALARSLARYPAIAVGHSNPDRWERIETSLVSAGALVRAADPADFIYDPDAAARRRHDLRSFAKLGAALLVALAVAVWLLVRWRRGVPVGAPAEAAAATDQPAPAAPPEIAAAAAAAAEPAPRLPPSGADLNAALGRLERTIRQRLPQDAAFRLSLLPLLWRCRAEAHEVRQLVLDLVAAAVADLKVGGELVVGTRNYAFDEASLAAMPGAQVGEFVRVTVRDGGAGLSETALDRIFDPATTARPAVAAAAAILRAQGGFVRIESAEGIGTAVHLYFPRATPAEAGKPGEPAAAAE
jgi:ABC-type nitrate/sulfonate/bicarbonate transport system substrate-binding protein